MMKALHQEVNGLDALLTKLYQLSKLQRPFRKSDNQQLIMLVCRTSR